MVPVFERKEASDDGPFRFRYRKLLQVHFRLEVLFLMVRLVHCTSSASCWDPSFQPERGRLDYVWFARF